MKKYFLPLFFSVFLIVVFVATMINPAYLFNESMYGDNVYREGERDNNKFIEFTKDFERNLSNDLGFRNFFLDGHHQLSSILYPYIPMIDNDVVKTPDGFLYRCQKQNNVLTNIIDNKQTFDDDIENIKSLNAYLSSQNIPFLFYAAPNRYVKDKVEFKNMNIVDYSNDNQDAFLSLLNNNNIKNVDLRKFEPFNTLDAFYKTDHHWTTNSAFEASRIIANDIETTLNIDLKVDYYLNPDNYKVTTIPNSYVGSYGVRVNKQFYTADDFDFIEPTYDTDFYYECYDSNELIYTNTGNFETTLMNKINSQNSSNSLYHSYLYGYIENRITNNQIKNCTVLVISDSFGRPLVPFLSTAVEQIYYVDPQQSRFNKNIISYINEINPDMVIMLNNAQNVYIPVII